ncbi:MAG: hypothetical protein OEZ01_06905 [Candidatus Heimdallarchaeota archaeon]|nr:hypothetical protein [Candidatus Heimdallarchaeota archaeon]MDH5645719.1 hypothetical protein [Candidatus Heimdallarchaeota archaeon]
MAVLQDLLHCEKHCMNKIREEGWNCGLKKHYKICTQGCHFGTDFTLPDEEYFQLPDPDDIDASEYVRDDLLNDEEES